MGSPSRRRSTSATPASCRFRAHRCAATGKPLLSGSATRCLGRHVASSQPGSPVALILATATLH
eukprot:2197437-Heterocapsa_arctica.AAC.1